MRKFFAIIFALFGFSAEMPEAEVLPERKRSSKHADLHTSAPAYAQRFKGPVGGYILQRQTQVLGEFLDGLDSNSVLDVGGGHAQNIHILKQKGYEVTVLGTSAEVPKSIQVPFENGEVQYVVGEIDSFPFADASFDVCVSMRQLSHVPDPVAFIRELTRVAAKFVIFDYAPYESFNLAYPVLYPIKQMIEGDSRRYRMFSLRAVDKRLRENGFERIALTRQFLMPIGLHRLLQSKRMSEIIETNFERLHLTEKAGAPAVVLAERLSKYV